VSGEPKVQHGHPNETMQSNKGKITPEAYNTKPGPSKRAKQRKKGLVRNSDDEEKKETRGRTRVVQIQKKEKGDQSGTG